MAAQDAHAASRNPGKLAPEIEELLRELGVDESPGPWKPWDTLTRREKLEWLEPARNNLYHRNAGEVEARNVQTRRDFTPDERRASPPWETEDVPRDRQIVRFGGLEKALSTDALPMDEASRMARADEMFPIEGYHGAGRLDRLLEKPGLDPDRATSGPMPFFTDSPRLASTYAKNKAATSGEAFISRLRADIGRHIARMDQHTGLGNRRA